MTNIKFLSSEEIIHIHERLTIDAASSDDPISPAGIKNRHLLESAISRQYSGFSGKLKYNHPISNAATLCYGICSNHPLHNGNKRTALVSLMCHLDRNGLMFNSDVNQSDLYSFMLKVASHNFFSKNKRKRIHDQSDAEVNSMSDWLKKKTRKIEKQERLITYTQLEKILKEHEIYFKNNQDNYVDLIKYDKEVIKHPWYKFKKDEEKENERKIGNIPYFSNRAVGRNLIKSIRKQANLTPAYGIDSSIFYGHEATPDDFIIKYKNVLSKLAKT